MNIIPEKFPTNQKALEYIGYLAASTGTDISSWNIPEIFIGGDLQNFVLDTTEINKRFFEKAKASKEGEKKKCAPKITLTDEQVMEAGSKRLALGSRTYGIGIKNWETNLRDHEQTINNYEREIEKYRQASEKAKTEIARLKTEWDALKAQPLPDLKEQIKEILKAGFFSDFKWHEGYLWCLTKEVFMRSHIIKTSLVSLGRFALKIDMSNFSTQVYPYENNVFVGMFCHPFHDGGNYKFCGLHDEFNDCINKMDFVKYMELFAALLQDASGMGSRHFEPEKAGRNPALQQNFYPK